MLEEIRRCQIGAVINQSALGLKEHSCIRLLDKRCNGCFVFINEGWAIRKISMTAQTIEKSSAESCKVCCHTHCAEGNVFIREAGACGLGPGKPCIQ